MVQTASADEARAYLRQTRLQDPRGVIEEEIGADELRKGKSEPADAVQVLEASTCLIMPFSFHSAEEHWEYQDESPFQLSEMMLSRTVTMGEELPLWERSEVVGAEEFSLHFQKLLGVGGAGFQRSTETYRLKLSASVCSTLFCNARLWAYSADGPAVGRRVVWTEVELVIFPHGAILCVSIDWKKAPSSDSLTLKELRTWTYLSKFRQAKLGVSRGWTFETPSHQVDESLERSELGDDLYDAIYGEEAITIGLIANWLVKLPNELGGGNKYRVPLYNYNIHHTIASVDSVPADDHLHNIMRQIRHQDGARTRLKDDYMMSDPNDVVIQTR